MSRCRASSRSASLIRAVLKTIAIKSVLARERSAASTAAYQTPSANSATAASTKPRRARASMGSGGSSDECQPRALGGHGRGEPRAATAATPPADDADRNDAMALVSVREQIESFESVSGLVLNPLIPLPFPAPAS